MARQAAAPVGAVRRLAELTGLCGIVLAEPVLTALRDGADVFVTRRAEPLHVVLLTLAVVLAVPVALLLLSEAAALFGPGARDATHRALVAGLGGLVVIRLLGDAGLPGPVTVTLSLAGGLGLWWATGRDAVHLWLQYLGLFPLLLALWFLGTDPVRGLVFDDQRAGEAVEVANPVPVLLVVYDELPLASVLDDGDRIDAEQFPNLAALATDATWFRNTTGVSPTTPEAVPPVLTGRYPDGVGRLPTVEEHPDNLFTLLRDDYAVHAQESVTALCPPDLCAGGSFAGGHPLRELVLDAADLWQRQLFGGGDDRRVDFAIRQSDPNAPSTIQAFADGMTVGDRPALDVLHTVYPHQPWYHLPSGLTYEAPFVAEGLDQYAEYAWLTDFAADTGRQRHLLQARHNDVMLGVLLDRLRDLGTYDETLVIVTADHGAAFETGEPLRGVSEENADSVLWVPLLVKAPRQDEGRIDDRPARTVDVLPTIADVVAMDLAPDVDGVSLLGEPPVVQGPDLRRVYDWGFNRLEPNADGYSEIDGEAGFASLLAQAPPGSGEDPDLAFYRWGRHGDLVGQPVDDLGRAPGRDLVVELDADGGYRSSAEAQQDVYVAGTALTGEPLDLAIAVNGVIGAWAEVQVTGRPGERRFWGLVPPELLRDDGEDDLALYVIEGDRSRRRLAPVPLP